MSSSERELKPRLRADVEWIFHGNKAAATALKWVARDPLTSRFFSFGEVEHSAIQLMNGVLPISQILQQIQRLFPTAGIDSKWLANLLARLQSHHLLVPQSRGEAVRMARAGNSNRARGIAQQLLSPLAIRVPIVNPSWVLQHLQFPAAILFNRAVVLFWVAASVLVYFFVLRELTNGVGSRWELDAIRGDRWLLLFACYLLAKSLHELGHMLACVYRRTQCNEIGVLFLCLAPCLYCDTTDSWKLSSKWQRAGIAAAGMYVELILATLAAVVWLFTRDGTPHYVAGSLMVVCSIGTLLVNSNPFLKYDGYYIFSDIWGVPNLSDQSREALRSLGLAALAGRPLSRARFDAPLHWLILYAMAAALYRLFILGAILWISWTVLTPMGLGLVAVALTASLLFGMLLGQLNGFRVFFREVIATGSIRFLRWVVFFSALFLIVVAIVKMPLPSYIRARAVTDYADKLPVFASQTAELVFAADTNILLHRGDLLVAFDSPESRLELLKLQGQKTVIAQELEQLRSRSAVDSATAYQIPSKVEELSHLQDREQLLHREINALRHHAPYDGYLLRSSSILPRPITAPRDDRFSTQPLDPRSLHAVCERSTLVGWFSRKETLTLTAILPAHAIRQLALGMEAAIQWDGQVGAVARGLIVRIAPDPIVEMPESLIGDPSLLSARNETGRFVPEQPHYAVTITVQDSQSLPSSLAPRIGAPATVQFSSPARTLLERAQEFFEQHVRPL